MYAESTELLFVESTFILEQILRLVSGTYRHKIHTDKNIQTQNCAPFQCTVWPRNEPHLFCDQLKNGEKSCIRVRFRLFHEKQPPQ